MKLGIEVKKLEDDSYMATVDWSKGDAGEVGTPGCIIYADSAEEAYEILQNRLSAKGHIIIN